MMVFHKKHESTREKRYLGRDTVNTNPEVSACLGCSRDIKEANTARV